MVVQLCRGNTDRMTTSDSLSTTKTAPLFRPPQTPAPRNPIPSSSPAFATPVHPVRTLVSRTSVPSKPSILPILLPAPTLRPLAFRTFTKKYNLTLTSSALQALASFVGKHCGTGWREEGLAERVLEEVARSWKKNGGGVIVEGEGDELKGILRNLEPCMAGGKIVQGPSLSRQSSFALGEAGAGQDGSADRPAVLRRDDSQSSLGRSSPGIDEAEEEEDHTQDPRTWLTVIGSWHQPRLVYNAGKKHFDRCSPQSSRHHSMPGSGLADGVQCHDRSLFASCTIAQDPGLPEPV